MPSAAGKLLDARRPVQDQPRDRDTPAAARSPCFPSFVILIVVIADIVPLGQQKVLRGGAGRSSDRMPHLSAAGGYYLLVSAVALPVPHPLHFLEMAGVVVFSLTLARIAAQARRDACRWAWRPRFLGLAVAALNPCRAGDLDGHRRHVAS